jgi:Pectate lyase superfamily protein
MALTKASYSMISGEIINAIDYGATGNGTTDDTAAIQAAITAATSQKKILRIPAGTYVVSSSLTLSATNWLVGDGKNNTIIQYSGSSSAIICSGWGGKIQGLSVVVTNASANGIEVGTASRNCSIEDVYLDATAVGSSQTGAGFYLNAGTGFSGGITISTSYTLQFKYGVKMVGTNLNTGTWTTVCMYNLYLVGNSGSIVSGSAGIYMDGYTNGIGTCMYGGTIEAFALGIYVADNSFGGTFNTDMENNTANYQVGNAFNGNIVAAQDVPMYSRASNGAGGSIWEQYYLAGGAGPIQENYYAPKYLVFDTSGNAQEIKWFNNSTSIINGGSLDANAQKFGIGIGNSGTYGIIAQPNLHYIRLADRTIHWDAQSPAVTGGAAWVQGSVCYNSTAAVGQPKGWICTVSGTPGTWVSMGNL